MIAVENTREYYRNYFMTHFIYSKELVRFLRWLDMMLYNRISWERFIYVIEYVEPEWSLYWNTFLDDLEKNK